MKSFAYILGTILFSVYGQIIVKWQVSKAGSLPSPFGDKLLFLIALVLNPWIISGLVGGFLALLCWMGAMTHFQLSYAYPFLSLAFVLVLVFSALLFHETVTLSKLMGTLLIVVGIIVASRG
jgi:multidrug transporter EmrE-like cation transporter